MDEAEKHYRVNNYEFDMERMTSFEGDTGPYLQYAHARLCSITRKAALTAGELLAADFSLLSERHAVDLVRSLAQWPDVFINTIKTQEPVTVLTYLFKMTHLLSSSYEHLQVVGSEPQLKSARMALYTCARQVLNNGMRLLGLSPVERYVCRHWFEGQALTRSARVQDVKTRAPQRYDAFRCDTIRHDAAAGALCDHARRRIKEKCIAVHVDFLACSPARRLACDVPQQPLF